MLKVGNIHRNKTLASLDCCGCNEPQPQAQIRGLGSVNNRFSEAMKYCEGYDNGSAFERGQCNAWYSANKKANSKFPGILSWTGQTMHSSYYYKDVYDLIDVYTKAAETGKIPEYAHPSDKSGAQSEKVIKELKKLRPNYYENFIRVVMYELHQGVLNGVTSAQMLYPKTYNVLKNSDPIVKKNVEEYTKVVTEEAKDEAQPGIFDNIATTLKYTAYVVFGALLLWGGVKVYTTYQSGGLIR